MRRITAAQAAPTRAGTPPTMARGGTSRFTTAPAAITASFPMVTPGRMVQLAPIQTLLPMVTGFAVQMFSRRFFGESAWLTVVMTVPGAIRTLSPMTTGARSRIVTL